MVASRRARLPSMTVSENESGGELQAGEPAGEKPSAEAQELAGEKPSVEAQEPPNEKPSTEPPGPAEITAPLPPVQAERPAPLQAAINQPTTALPLLDLLAPRQPGSPGGTPLIGMADPAAAPGPGSAGRFLSQPGYPGGPLPGGRLPAAPGATMIGRPAPPPKPPGPGRRGWLLVAGAVGCVVLLGLVGWLAMGSLPSGERPATTTEGASPTSAIVAAGGYQFTRYSMREDTDCAANAYGQVADFFRDSPCSGLRRALFTSSIDGRPVVVSVSTVTMPNERGAAALKRLADTNGTGNVTDLLRAGVRVPALPESLSDPSYTSDQTGGTVVIVESDYAEPAMRADDALERMGQAAIELGHSG